VPVVGHGRLSVRLSGLEGLPIYVPLVAPSMHRNAVAPWGLSLQDQMTGVGGGLDDELGHQLQCLVWTHRWLQ